LPVALGVSETIGVKATTNEKMGIHRAEEGIAAMAVATWICHHESTDPTPQSTVIASCEDWMPGCGLELRIVD